MTNSIDSQIDGAIPRLSERRANATAPAPRTSTDPRETQSPADLLALTGEARALKALEQDLARSPEMDTARVRELREAIAGGRYEVDAARVAEKLLDMDSRLP